PADTPAGISLRQLHRGTVRGPERLSAYTLYPAAIDTAGFPSVVLEENAGQG
ncbi:MAG: hypothetical protein JO047_17880, partial [Alphaproteobacteria bacterium]|nr:hypothetical protein [Alphaproteobacteria bacterium]